MAEANICRQCSAPMQLQSIGTVAGEDGVLKISVSDFPALVCERGHRQFISRDFPMKLLEKLADGDKTGLPAGKKQGLLFKKCHCGKCGEPLGADGESRPFGFDVKLADAPQMRVEFTLPVYKCAACGEQQLRDRDEIEGLVPAALAHGFQAAGFRPQA